MEAPGKINRLKDQDYTLTKSIEEIERKLLFMVAEEHQLTIGEKSGGARRHRSLMGEISQQEI